MGLLIIVATLVCLGMALALFRMARKAAFSVGELPVTAEWIDELSIERYRPMMRLLDGGDIEFLRTQPGFNPKMATRLRAQRCQIFRGYLRCLGADFRRICAAIKILMLQSSYDRPDLASVLVQHQMMFAGGVAVVQVRLLLYRWGLCDVDVTNLVKIFDVVRLELRSLVPASSDLAA